MDERPHDRKSAFLDRTGRHKTRSQSDQGAAERLLHPQCGGRMEPANYLNPTREGWFPPGSVTGFRLRTRLVFRVTEQRMRWEISSTSRLTGYGALSLY